MLNQNELTCKILVLGESKVGKSSILNQFTENMFKENLNPTLGIDYKIKKINVGETVVKLQIWDTAGQERFRSITEGFYKGVHGVLLVFDLSDMDSFKKVQGWIESITSKAGEDVVICLVGNKDDLRGTPGVKMVPKEDIKVFAQKLSLHYLDVSAKANKNIDEAFQYLAQRVKQKFQVLDTSQSNVNLNRENGRGGKCCQFF